METEEVIKEAKDVGENRHVVYPPPRRTVSTVRPQSMDEYQKLYNRSINEPDEFWDEMAKKTLTWFQPYDTVRFGSFEKGDIAWFLNGKLNASYQCLDRHLQDKKDKIAIIWEGDEPSECRKLTYYELFTKVCQLANALKFELKVQKGDIVCLYMPMCPEAAVAMLACARIGAIHSVVFGGFSVEALRDRIVDSKSKVVITGDEGRRGGRSVALKKTVDAAISGTQVSSVIVFKRSGTNDIKWDSTKDIWWHEICDRQRPYCVPEPMDSEDILFLLYTSGSTGKPKGLVHTTAGYLLNASLTHRHIFDLSDDASQDIYACMADVGWITGHSYVVYAPLINGTTTVLFESLPTYPDAGRYWDVVSKHKVNILYTAPTAIRSLIRYGDEFVTKYDLSSLRVLGSVGEPINPNAWEWYYRVVGKEKCFITDTYWQTETGAIMITPLPGITPLKPGSATLPFYGIKPVLLDAHSGTPITENGQKGVLAFSLSWPSIGRSVYGDHARYLSTYMSAYPGLYFTGDGAYRDEDGYYWIIGRVDDVMNVAGHRLGTAEVESALVRHPACNEAAVVAVPDEIKGQGIFAYVTLKEGFKESKALIEELRMEVRKGIGPFATPKAIVVAPTGLPKTRSGKIMRRILRKIASGESSPEQLGDTSTLSDPSVVDILIQRVKELPS